MNTRLYTILVSLLFAAATANAQVKIYGNVYGGGEKAQVIEPCLDSIKNHVIQDNDLATLFDKKHIYTTYVRLGSNAEVYGRTFGGGMGHADSRGESAGRVTGQTDVVLDGATVWSEIFGGGENADVRGNTLLHFKKGKAGHNAFGGGLGLLGGTDELPDNQRDVLASADIKLIPANYTLITDDSEANLNTLKSYYNADGTTDVTSSNWWQVKKTGESFVVFDGKEEDGNATYTHYEFEKERTLNRNADGNVVAGGDGKYYTERPQYNPENENRLFSINHNIYGGGMTASRIEGKTFVHINYGMVNDDMMNYEYGGKSVWSTVYNSIANAQFCVFGGGYGYYSQVNGDTYVTMDIMGSGEYKYITDFTKDFENKWGVDRNPDPDVIAAAADQAIYSHGAPGRSCMDIIGGGYNGRVLGTTNIEIGGDVVVRKVYGGGYYASVGNTNVNILSGIFNRVYGGGLIGNVYGKATLNVGQVGLSDNIKTHNTHLLVKDAIYGGNDVSGTVGTTEAKEVTAPNGVKYNVYSPRDDENHGVRLNMYGGLVLGDVYGAGNGNHPGYTNPEHMQFDLSEHPSENYRKVIKPDNESITPTVFAHVYKYRPRTGRVVMNLQGNAGTNFNDAPLVDKVRVYGRTFAGGNSCNVGIWNGEMDDISENYSDVDWDFTKDIATNTTNNASWHPGDNFKGQGHVILNIGSHVQLGNRNDSHETPNGLFMGNNGQHMVTQTANPKQLENYHHYFNPRTLTYLPGFLVYDKAGNDIGRKAGLKSFAAFINNILTWTDNVTLTVKELDNSKEAADVWMSNFVGGGYRGSMKAFSANGSFIYTLPTGVTIGHSVVGGAFNAHVVYRIYQPDGDNGYAKDTDGNYIFQITIPDGWETDKQAQKEGKEYGNYLSQYSDGTILRYNFEGGIMGNESGSIAKPDGSRCRQVRNGAFDFTSDTKYDKSKAIVQLNLRNKLEPDVIEAHDEEPAKVHGGIVYGGCFNSGYIDGDVWVDYRCSLSPLCTDDRFFDKTKEDMYGHVDNLDVHNALNVFGAGYGEDTHTMGDTYLRVLHNGSSDKTIDYPFMYNVFGGGNKGTVAGNTNVYYNVGRQGTVVGSLYGGGYLGTINGNTFVELAGGLLLNAYGGSRQADILGAAHVWAYDGAKRPDGEDEETPEKAPLLIGNIYGGNDISGTIGTADNGMEAIWSKKNWTALKGMTFNSYVQVGGTEESENGYPLIGNVFAGGNGEKTKQTDTAPVLAKTLLEINGGTTIRAFGGGNKATVTKDAYIFVNSATEKFAQFTFLSEYQKDVINKTVLKNIYQGYKWEGLKLTVDEHHANYLYGGNNLTSMAIQPTWNLAKGNLGNVYSGGNLGDMTHPHGINITVSSPEIFIKNLFGGCRMANVKPTKLENQAESDFNTYWDNTSNYGATVICTGGYISNVYGGNDISGTVEHGTKVMIDGAVDNDVYCAGNGNYLYQWDKDVVRVTETKVGDDVIYKVPAMEMFGGENANNTQKLLTINAYRPSVARSSLDIAGGEEEQVQAQDLQEPRDIKVAFVKGNVYCGGNASTVTGDAATKLTIGSHVNVHGLFMGSDGYDYSQQEYIAKFAKLNDFDMAASTNFTGLTYGEEPNHVPSTLMTSAEEQFYPNLLALYMKAVEMKSQPELTISDDAKDAYIGTWCGGGNRGSMTSQTPVTVTIPDNITIYDKVVAGCMDANVQYVGTEDTGGYYRPLAEGQGTTKLNYTIKAKFLPRYMSVPTGMDDAHRNPEGETFMEAREHYFLYENVSGTDADAQYKVGNNIYGGCYESGDVLGDVILNVNSQLLEEPLKTENTTQPNRQKLDNASQNEVAAFNVYGAGMGMNSNVWGNVTINMAGSANNVYGGGRSGTLIGNATINMQNGIVYRHIIGGSDSGYLYGSTQIAVGNPTSYIASTNGTYTLTRADNNELTNTIKLAKGDLISETVYDMLTDKSNFAVNATGAAPTGIHIGGGIYGGGYAKASGSTVYARKKTVLKYTAEKCPKNPTTGIKNTSLDGFGGNSTIMVKDDDATDNITISTIIPVVKSGMASTLGYFTRGGVKKQTNAVGDTEYSWNHQPDDVPDNEKTYYDLTGNGGVYGDGHLSYVEGFRSADIQGYGYATYTPQQPKLLNTMQRFDVARVKDCCIMLQGAHDFAAQNKPDAANYSVSRIKELQMASSLTGNLAVGSASTESADSQHSQPKMRNYLGFYKQTLYLGALKSDVAFADDRYSEAGVMTQGKSYQTYKQTNISTNYPTGNDNDKIQAFRQRNLGTAKNMIGINNGHTLKIQKESIEGDDKIIYGPAIGVTEVKLLTLVQGEGGGYIYAANKHADDSKFLNTSGNFVFPGTKAVSESDNQFIVDDCFPNPFQETAQGDCHYWYVEGNKFYFNGTLTGYTADNAELTFNLDNKDQIISLSGTKRNSPLKVTSINWVHAHSDGYTCDIANTERDYEFSLSVSDQYGYNTDGGHLTNLSRITSATETPLEYGSEGNIIDNPLLGIQLTDHVDNNANSYYEQHLKEPCVAKIVLENTEDNTTYIMNLEVVYLKGPSVEGNVVIGNCALPGEYIHAYVDGLKVETNESMPVTRTFWRVVEPVDEGAKTEEIARMNTTEIDNSIIDLKALYRHNGWKLQYVVVANNIPFPISVANDATAKTLLVHNYHRMTEVMNRQSNNDMKLDPQAGARIYINNVEDLQAFAQWINAGKVTEGVHFYLQNSIKLPATWNITGAFAGTLHGDGYVLDASDVTGDSKTLFGANYDKEHAKVYNLGVIGANITTVAESAATIINSFDNTIDEADLKYGKNAYALSHFHNADNNAAYVTEYYYNNDEMGGDWRYALTTANNSGDRIYLRTAAPAYGSVNTSHNAAHTDAAYTPIEHDYLFFGQTLTPNGDVQPVHIADDESNRIQEAEGYYNSVEDKKFYYNTVAAWAMQPGLTSVRFDNAGGNVPATIGAAEGVTRNLLVYEADHASKATDSKSFFHVKGNKGVSDRDNTKNTYRCENLALVDKQDFNASYAFTATNASYERTPACCVETRGTAWESLCLPFAPTTVKAVKEGEEDKVITHFYGSASTDNIDGTEGVDNAHNVGHEYWLRELTHVKTENDRRYAQFSRPATANYVEYQPYIVSFPGDMFYEFSLSGRDIRWEQPNAVIYVTDHATKTMTRDGLIYAGTFANENGATGKYALNDAGSSFDSNEDILPFRGYLSSAASPIRSRSILIGSDYDDMIHGETTEPVFTPDGEASRAFLIKVKGLEVTVISSDAMKAPCHTISGASLGLWMIPEGESKFTVPAPGVYLLNGIKFVVR